ncbi:MAG TPA: hypothetical protein VLV81_08815 [Acidimicrobiia bacterium]|nr:hypothetical protein [Acidimicrobiia bacterium]
MAPRSWLLDPFAPTTRLRWWGGDLWSAWVVDGLSHEPYISWLPELGELSPPIQWGLIVPRLAVVPPLPVEPSSVEAATSDPVRTDDGTDELAPVRARRTGRRALIAAMVSVVVLGITGVAGATHLPGNATNAILRSNVVPPRSSQSTPLGTGSTARR